MTDAPQRAPVSFHPDSEIQLQDGVPIVEMAMELEVGNCVRCGSPPDKDKGGMLENARVVDGVLQGDNVCLTCIEDTAYEDMSQGILDFLNEVHE